MEAPSLTLFEAEVSPCADCATTPCCTHLPLHRFEVTNLTAYDHARYLLNFDRIELALAADGMWHVYYRVPCRHLDVERGMCRVHGKPEQPSICANYNPYGCWYRRALGATDSASLLRIDRRRLEALGPHLRFDQDRDLIERPDWPTMRALFAELPIESHAWGEAPEDEAYPRWLELAAGAEVDYALPPNSPHAPCEDCAAYCCTNLIFPHPTPQSRSSFDFLLFALGFPGMEVAVDDAGWALVVRTRCRHLTDAGDCGVFGQIERPHICRYYDAMSCQYRVQFGEIRPPGHLRVRHAHLAWLTETATFDAHGQVVELPPTDAIRAHVENRWAAAVHDAEVRMDERLQQIREPRHG